MGVEGFRERHDSCRFGTYRADEDVEGIVVAGCEHPQVSSRYDEHFCARECPAYHARAGRQAHGCVAKIERDETSRTRT